MEPTDALFPVTFDDIVSRDNSTLRVWVNRPAAQPALRLTAFQPTSGVKGSGSVDLDVDQVEELHRRLGEWLVAAGRPRRSAKWRSE